MNRENNDVAGDMQHLRRSLSNRHIQLIAIGGAIGTAVPPRSWRACGYAASGTGVAVVCS
ncbi:MAG: hypothetical protein E7E80_05305 [Cutibacterium avidum]|nr:hypothetical protein [Cutibacterium avidum]MDU3283260.1 hypothetical protein [Cutibacterium avidum]